MINNSFFNIKNKNLKLKIDSGNIGILDGTNTRRDRRRMIESYLKSNMKKNYKIIWIESICDKSSIIENNIFKTKINSPDYKSWEDPEKAAEDFRNRIREYEKIYEKVSIENDGESSAFIQIINQGEKIVARNVKGYIDSKIISYLTNLHTGNRPIYFLRHGNSECSNLALIGGDSSLRESGEKYANYVANFFAVESLNFKHKPVIYSSTLKRCIQTADKLVFLSNYKAEKYLDELNAGLRDGISYVEFEQNFPDEFRERMLNKLHFRYPRGESYMDVIQRIEPVIFEIERIREPVIVVGHQGMLRCLYGYFAEVPLDKIPILDIPMNTIIKFIPEPYGFCEVRYHIDPESGVISKNDKSHVMITDNLIHTPK